VFTNTFAMFAAGRAFEQVRNSIAYPHLNVTVVAPTAACPWAWTEPPTSAARTTPSCAACPGCWCSPPATLPRCARPSRPCWTTRVPPTCAWAAWRWSRSPTERPATASSWARAPCCGTAATSPSSPPV
jgi:hypothetical protein